MPRLIPNVSPTDCSLTHGHGCPHRHLPSIPGAARLVLCVLLPLMAIGTPRAARSQACGVPGPAHDVTLLGQYSPPGFDTYSDVHGLSLLREGTLVEIAIILGHRNGMSGALVLDVTDPAAIDSIAFFPGPSFDVKTYVGDDDTLAYVCDDLPDATLTILDLGDPLHPEIVTAGVVPFHAHNLFVDPGRRLLYAGGNLTPSFRTRIYSLEDPRNPVQIGDLPGPAFHDVHAFGSNSYLFDTRRQRLWVFRVEDGGSTAILGTASWRGAHIHSGWPTPDGNYLIAADEL
ncbi:MAG: hypothetical protein KC729_09210, partial [Candidatus Eisenbacteria bacterium]|nr:hypothetical protein [Candidatus Eisenbacteria bacterium]